MMLFSGYFDKKKSSTRNFMTKDDIDIYYPMLMLMHKFEIKKKNCTVHSALQTNYPLCSESSSSTEVKSVMEFQEMESEMNIWRTFL